MNGSRRADVRRVAHVERKPWTMSLVAGVYFGYLLLKFSLGSLFTVYKWLRQPKIGHPGTPSARRICDNPSVQPYEFDQRFLATREILSRKYDFIIVGAGSAGCVLAEKLSRNPLTQVLLLEAGGEAQLAANVSSPRVAMSLWRSEVDWGFESVPQESLLPAGRTVPLERGKVLGGSSSLNYCMWVRGAKEDFDQWASEYGCGEKWSYDGVLQNFKNLESVREESFDPNDRRLVDPTRGTAGPMHIRTVTPARPEIDAYLTAAAEAGVPANPDYNTTVQRGCGYTQMSVTPAGRRADAFSTFVEPILAHRKNLVVASEAFVHRVLFSDFDGIPKAQGVVVETRDGSVYETLCTSEVILCAGAIQTPQLLMVSGIGDEAELQRNGIDCLVNIPAVGKFLQDHPVLFIPFVHAPSTEASGSVSMSSSLNGVSFVHSDVVLRRQAQTHVPQAPDFEVNFLSGLSPGPCLKLVHQQVMVMLGKFTELFPRVADRIALRLARREVTREYTKDLLSRTLALAYVLHGPQSRGHVSIRSASMRDKPAVDLGFLRRSEDMDALVWAVKHAIRLMQTPPLSQYVTHMEYVPGIPSKGSFLKNFLNATDEQIQSFIRHTAGTTWHYSCTARMGADNAPLTSAVCDPRLRVRCVAGLRVADCSVMPQVVSANTNATAMMIGDKCGEMLAEEYGLF